ncbi:MAG TPA: hypothetical protein VJN44_10600 [Roseateles sp.]|nr:hypothetical protein [Roseateles sp.]
MAISWLTALKAVPWADVIEATPVIVKGARRLFKRSQDEAAEQAEPSGPPQTLAEALDRLQRLEGELAQLSQQQADSAALLQSLAEQNAQLVAAIEVLRLRSRLLLWLCGGLSAAAAAVLAWSLMK